MPKGRLPHTREESERVLWSKIDVGRPDECWHWLGFIGSTGYGRAWLYGRGTSAHRAVFTVVHGVIPLGLMVRHKCDNPKCCNPGHLELGTAADNVRDSVERGRRADKRGEKTGTSRLTERDVLEIRAARAVGTPWKEIAANYPLVSVAGVMQAGRGKRWRHLPGVPPRFLRGGHPA